MRKTSMQMSFPEMVSDRLCRNSLVMQTDSPGLFESPSGEIKGHYFLESTADFWCATRSRMSVTTDR